MSRHLPADEALPFGALVRRLRLQQGWTQDELAARSGLNVTTVSNIERGSTQRLFTDTIDNLAAAFHISPGQLDPRRLADAVAEEARTLTKRAIIEKVLRLPDEEAEEVMRIADEMRRRRAQRRKRRKS
jgi:transcriptional regulator with XRE-family HTH domain